MRIHEFYGEELEDVASESFMPVIAWTRPEYHGSVAFQELGDAVTLSRSHWGGPMSSVRTDLMAARATGDNLMLFCVQMAGQAYIRQHDRFAELTAGSGVLSEARSSWKRVSPTAARSLALRFSRELLPLRTAEITEASARSVNPTNPAMQMMSTNLAGCFRSPTTSPATSGSTAAQAMLSDPRCDRAISSIAAAVGFRDLSTFVRAFRRQFGTTPTGRRRAHFAGPLPRPC